MTARHASALKKLAGQTLVYGLSTVFARLINYALVPLHSRAFDNQADYGVVSEIYAWVTFLNVIFLYGMETAFFRHAGMRKEGEEGSMSAVFGSGFWSLVLTSLLGAGLLMAGSGGIADALSLAGQGSTYVICFAGIIALDAVVAIPFARLRLAERPFVYLAIKLLNVGVNVGLNYWWLLPVAQGESPRPIPFGLDLVGAVFLANLAGSAITLLVFLPMIAGWKPGFDRGMWGKMVRYGAPFILTGLAGMVNEVVDRILLGRLMEGTIEENRVEVGIYSAAYKLSIFMTLAVQAFRMGAEPFFFRMAGERDAREVYATIMRYFVVVGCGIALAVSVALPWLRHILGTQYQSGLGVVPVLLFANLFLGLFYNLAIWYKLTDKTRYGAWLAVFGAAITLIGNVVLIPLIGYWGSAWTTLGSYGLMALASAIWGRQHYPVPYAWGRILTWIGLTGAMICAICQPWISRAEVPEWSAFSLVLISVWLGAVLWFEGRPLLRGR